MQHKIIRTALCSFLLCSVLICGCSKQNREDTTTKVTLNEVAHSIFYTPMYVAIEEGYFAAEGIDLELVTGFGANTLVQNL